MKQITTIKNLMKNTSTSLQVVSGKHCEDSSIKLFKYTSYWGIQISEEQKSVITGVMTPYLFEPGSVYKQYHISFDLFIDIVNTFDLKTTNDFQKHFGSRNTKILADELNLFKKLETIGA